MKAQSLKFKKAHELAAKWSSYSMRKKLSNWSLTYRDFFAMALASLKNITASTKELVLSVKNAIVGTITDRGSMFNFSGEITNIMKVADSQNNFVGSIIENAINGKLISEKQAWCVAYFAQKNNLI